MEIEIFQSLETGSDEACILNITVNGWDINDYQHLTNIPATTSFSDYFEHKNIELNGTYHADHGTMERHYRYASAADSFEIILYGRSSLIRSFDIIFNFSIDFNSPIASLSIDGVDYSQQFTEFLQSIYCILS